MRQDGGQLLYDWTTGAIEVYDVAGDPGRTVDLGPNDERTEGLWEALLPELAAIDGLSDQLELVKGTR